jgi:hypothetical protein
MADFFIYFFSPTTIGVLLGGVLAAIFTFWGDSTNDKKTRKWIVRGSLLFAIIIIVSSVVSSYQGYLDQKLIQDKTDKISKLTSKNNMLSEEITVISKTNTELAIKNSKLNEEIANSVTGGDSYGYVYLTPISKFPNKYEVMFLREGKYPLYDVEIRVKHMQGMRKYYMDKAKDISNSKNQTLDLHEFQNAGSIMHLRLGNIRMDQSNMIGYINLPSSAEEASYQIHIFARNGHTLQFVEFRKVNDLWKKGYAVYFKDKFVKKDIDKDLPKDDSPIWKENL